MNLICFILFKQVFFFQYSHYTHIFISFLFYASVKFLNTREQLASWEHSVRLIPLLCCCLLGIFLYLTSSSNTCSATATFWLPSCSHQSAGFRNPSTVLPHKVGINQPTFPGLLLWYADIIPGKGRLHYFWRRDVSIWRYHRRAKPLFQKVTEENEECRTSSVNEGYYYTAWCWSPWCLANWWFKAVRAVGGTSCAGSRWWL